MTQKSNEKPPTLVIRRHIHAKRDKVFEAWTKPQIMKDWFFPGKGRAEITNSLNVGGKYENRMFLELNACKATDIDPNGYIHSGEYLEIIPPEKIVFSWSSHLVSKSRVTVELIDLGDSTELILTHELLETEDLREKHNGGWEGCLTNLVNYLE